jgi:8-oxo-dGTP pyrophosphatase MutT (NUDIX family)
LPGGRLDPGEDPATCLAREVAEELGADVAVEAILDSWVYEALPQREVLIVTYRVRRSNQRAIRISDEHRRIVCAERTGRAANARRLPPFDPRLSGAVRHHKTLQDPLVKELRLAEVRALAEGNTLLPAFIAG